MIRAFSIVLVLAISGCASGKLNRGADIHSGVKYQKPKIHLHVYGALLKNADIYCESLRKMGYEVTLRNNSLPMSDEESFIVYNLSNLQYFEIEKVRSIFVKHNISINTVYSFQNGKHLYSFGNIGIYLM